MFFVFQFCRKLLDPKLSRLRPFGRNMNEIDQAGGVFDPRPGDRAGGPFLQDRDLPSLIGWRPSAIASRVAIALTFDGKTLVG